MRDYRNALFATQDWLVEVVGNITSEQFDMPTPCPGLPVKHMLTHMIMDAYVVEQLPILGRDPFYEYYQDRARLPELWDSYETDYVLGNTSAEIAKTLASSASKARENWTDAAMAGEYLMGWGANVTLTGPQTVGAYLFEIACHGFDLAYATGEDLEAPEEAATAALAAAREGMKDTYRSPDGIPFALEKPAPAGAGPTVQLAAFLGRSV